MCNNVHTQLNFIYSHLTFKKSANNQAFPYELIKTESINSFALCSALDYFHFYFHLHSKIISNIN